MGKTLLHRYMGEGVAERQAHATYMLNNLATGRGGDRGLKLYARMARQALATVHGEVVQTEEVSDRGIYSALASIDLIEKSAARTAAFVSATRQAQLEKGTTIVEIGAGATGILAVAAALAHPKHEVVAYEADVSSVPVAQVMAKACGVQNITFVAADGLTADLPGNIGLGITETFNRGLRHCDGLLITQRLAASGAQQVLPNWARLYGMVTSSRTNSRPLVGNTSWGNWQHLQDVDLMAPNPTIGGVLDVDVEFFGDKISVYTRADYYFGPTIRPNTLVLGGEYTDHITDSCLTMTRPLDPVAERPRYVEVHYAPSMGDSRDELTLLVA